MGKGAAAKMEVNEYRMSVHYGVCHGPVVFKKITIGDDRKVIWEGSVSDVSYVDVNLPNLFGGPKKEGGVAGRIWFLPGKPDQVMPAELAARVGLTPATCPAYRGLASVWFVASGISLAINNGLLSTIDGIADLGFTNPGGGFYWTANSPFIQAVAVEVEAVHNTLPAPDPMIGRDANPAHFIYEALTDSEWGMGEPSYLFNIPAFVTLAATMKAENLGLSLMWSKQATIETFINEILDHIQATVYTDPRTGLFSIKALRDDYDVESLRTINPTNAKLSNFSRRLYGESMANEIVATWTNPITEQEETVAVHDLANISTIGSINSDSRNYYAVRSAELATRLAERDLRASVAPLATCDAELDRSFWDVLPGEVFRLDWPKHKLDGLIVRVLKVQYGRKGSPGIKVALMEDVFSLRRAAHAVPPASGFDTAHEQPAPMDFVQPITMPLYLAQRELDLLGGRITYPQVSAGLLGYRNGNDVLGFDLYAEQVFSNGASIWTNTGIKTAVGRAKMATPLYQEAVSQVSGLPLIWQVRGPQIGGLVFIGTGGDTEMEIALLRGYSEGIWTVDRGVLDTVPRAWPLGTPVWFVPIQAHIIDDAQFYAVGDTPDWKLLTHTSLGTLPINSAPTVTGTMTARPHAPNRPGNVKINGTGFGEVNASGASNLTVTWATRNRLFEENVIVKWTDGPVTPEYLQMTVVTVYRANGTPMITYRGLYSENQLVIPIAHVQQEQSVFIRVSSERSGIASIQSYGLWVRNIPQIAHPAPPPTPLEPPPPPPPEDDGDPTPDPLPGTELPPFPNPGEFPGEWMTLALEDLPPQPGDIQPWIFPIIFDDF